jgi:hypothetical protein
MRKIFTIIFIYMLSVSYSQNNINNALILHSRAEQLKAEGITHLGNSEYLCVEIGNTGFSRMLSIQSDALKKIRYFANQHNAKYEIISTQEFRTKIPLPKVKINFRLLNQDGTPIIGKEESAKRLLDLKELLDADIITQEEFEKSAAPLKKALLGTG